MRGPRVAAIALLACLAVAGFSGISIHAVAETADQAAASGTEAPKIFAPKEGAEKFTFQAEVNRLMDILIHSLYSNKEIFLRELISNAADALDKIRFLSLTDKGQLGETSDLEIRVKVDHDNKILTIQDTGVGMTRDDLVKNLGTIAKSGTSAFLEQMQKSNDINLIGQFGVGFYSVYLVADYVEVVSKHNDDKQWMWESGADGNFAVSEDTGESIGRGTVLKIHIKEDAQEYLEEAKLKELVAKYSEFINFPIYLYSSKEVEKEVPVEEQLAGDDEKETEEETDADKDDDEDSDDEAPKTKKVKETVWDWDLLNDNKALWLRSPSDVGDDEYANFYKALAKSDHEKAAAHVHFRAEGDVEFRALLYVPESAPPNFLADYYGHKPSLKLYVRRVFISDDFEELIPRYLSFLKGIVDSDTLPLSVSRETLQAHASLKVIKKKLVRKVLDSLKKMSDAEKDAAKGDSADEDDKAEAEKYGKFWKEFGRALKLGIIEDAPNRPRLAKLLRVRTSTDPEKLVTLDDYVSRMKEDQKQIFYLTGASVEDLQKSVFLEKLIQKGYEVIFFTEPIDEYVMTHVTEYDDKKFQDASKDDVKLGKDDKKGLKKLKEEFKDVLAWWKELLGAAVGQVKVSTRLATSPAIVLTSKYGWSANMERIMKSQALGDTADRSYMKGMKTLEINPRHPLVLELKRQFEEDKESDKAAAYARLLWDTALLESGFEIEAPKEFNSRIYGLLAQAYNIQGDLGISAEDAAAAAAEEVTCTPPETGPLF
ncbi:heat shock protein Hsp90 [Coccomyxa subellipsoidea C-169]|uniref:Heat shock protein Hsp90 n=1 Tax=Coccomyxa subellipsoidea (strain C-169) TaxID=574566 RepID=I0Z919_COCSC|nr:heat shock protein Hsp90 [Coccomyxa subellipsoidea C-169]EIE27138.1 heat shock protein Hsp90 [Coccomyxa subellipsoidea C-169]|eukprot:XP_005651682.1 heat shock protein Hsp90 [Coccomyxa subellipsoidea C-169]